MISFASIFTVLMGLSLMASDGQGSRKEIIFPHQDFLLVQGECISCFEPYNDLGDDNDNLCPSCRKAWVGKGFLRQKNIVFSPPPASKLSEPVKFLSYSRDGQRLILVKNSFGYERIILIDSESGDEILNLAWPNIESAYLIMGGENFLAVNINGALILRMPAVGEYQNILCKCAGVKINKGQNLVICAFSDFEDYLVDLASLCNVMLPHKAGKSVCSSFDEENQAVVITGKNGITTIWSTEYTPAVRPQGRLIKTIDHGVQIANAAHSSSLNCIAISSLSGELSIVSLSAHPDDLGHRNQLGIVPNIKSMLLDFAGTHLLIIDSAGLVSVIDTATGKILYSLNDFIDCKEAQFSPDGSLFAITNSHGLLALFDAASGIKQKEINFSQENYTALFSFSPNGTHLTASHPDGSTKTWSIDQLLTP